MKSLQSTATKGMAHLGAGGILGKLISLGTTLILARILSPDDYGVMALAMIVIGFVGFFNEVGIGSAIVQKTELTISEVNGCFIIAVCLGFFLSVLTIFSSYLAALFFETPKLQAMIATLSAAFVLGSLNTIPMAFLRRNMQFKGVAVLNILEVITVSVVSLSLALAGWGVWSMVWGFLASNLTKTIGVYLLSSWRFNRNYNVREAMSLLSYGLHITVSRVFWYIYNNVDKVIIGKILNVRSVGVYDMAMSLATLPSSQITSIVTNVASPLFSKLQNDLPQISLMILKLTRGIAYITYPLLVGMLVCSHELVVVILGDKWLDMLVPFGALCLVGLLRSVDPLLSQVLISTGHAKKLSAYTAMCGVVMAVAVLMGGLWDGLRGVSFVWICVYPLLTLKLLSDVCKITGLSMLAYYKNLGPVFLTSLVMGIVVIGVREMAMLFTAFAPLLLGIEILSGVLAYVGWMIFMNRQSVGEIYQVLIDVGVPAQRLNFWPFVR